MAKHTLQELSQWQAIPLNIKVLMTKQRIRDWVNTYGLSAVYVSFSGGKDSTVLLHIAREMYGNDLLAIFADTGLEYPEIRSFVREFENVMWIKPKMNFRQVIETYGYPFISKPIAKRRWEYGNALENGKDVTQTSAYKEFNGDGTYIMNGIEKKSYFNKKKWKFLLDSPFKLSHKCCDVMKKDCFKQVKNLRPITAQMAHESMDRKRAWAKNGCNAYDAANPTSSPMAFWTDQDVLMYIKQKNIKIASVYGEIIPDEGPQVDGQMSISDYGVCGFNEKLKTSGVRRTGCMFCGFGCHLERSPGRFEQMKITHPKQYEYIMKPWDEGGLGFKDVIDWINAHNGKGEIIKY